MGMKVSSHVECPFKFKAIPGKSMTRIQFFRDSSHDGKYRGFNNFFTQNASEEKFHITMSYGPFVTTKDDLNS